MLSIPFKKQWQELYMLFSYISNQWRRPIFDEDFS